MWLRMSILLACLLGSAEAGNRVKESMSFDARGNVSQWPKTASRIPSGSSWFRTLANEDSAVSVIQSLSPGGDTVVFDGTLRNGCSQRSRYWSSGKTLNLEWSFWCRDTASFPKGLSLDFPQGTGTAWQRTPAGVWLPPDQTQGETVMQMTSRVRFGSGVEVLVPNVFHSFWKRVGDGHWRFEVLPLWKENSLLDQKTAGCPRLGANDTLRRFLQVRADTSLTRQIALSEHPAGHSSSLLMYFDDLPNRDAWAPVSIRQFPKTPNSFIPKLLEAHPRAKLGWVLVMDRSHWVRQAPKVAGWTFGRPWAFVDSIAPHEGKRQLLLWAPRKDSSQLTAIARLRGSTDPRYRLHVQARSAGELHVRINAKEGYYLKDSAHLARKDTVHVRRRLLGEWTHAFQAGFRGEFTGTVPRDSADTLEYEIVLPATDSFVLIDQAQLLQGDSVRNIGSGFELVMSSGIVADSERRHWSDFHGPEHLVSRAPASYLSFLWSLARQEGEEGWESRTYVGSHGYHHDPSLLEPDPAHEYMRNDTLHLRLTQSRVFAEMRQLDLYPWVSRFIRTPGFRYTGAALNSFVDSGMVMCDPGPVNAWLPRVGHSPSYRMLERNGKRMWGIALTWWSDGWPSQASALPTAALDSALARRRSAMTGGHPEQTFLAEQTFAAYDELLTGLERRYPGMGYITPTQWADHANAGYGLRIQPFDPDGEAMGVVLSGALQAGQSVVLEGGFTPQDTLVASLDGTDLPVRMEFPSCYVTLPAKSLGTYRLRFRKHNTPTWQQEGAGQGTMRTELRDIRGRTGASSAVGVRFECPEGSTSGCRGRIGFGDEIPKTR